MCKSGTCSDGWRCNTGLWLCHTGFLMIMPHDSARKIWYQLLKGSHWERPRSFKQYTIFYASHIDMQCLWDTLWHVSQLIFWCLLSISEILHHEQGLSSIKTSSHWLHHILSSSELLTIIYEYYLMIPATAGSNSSSLSSASISITDSYKQTCENLIYV